MNKELLENFISEVRAKNVLEIGFKGSVADILKRMCNMHSFDIRTSPLRFNSKALFKQNALVKLPFEDGEFSGTAAYKVLGYGDASFLFDEIVRVTSGPVFMVEDGIESFPLDYFTTRDDLWIDVASRNGDIIEAGLNFMEFFNRRDITKIFTRPGGSLNKFNLLVPEDIKSDVGIICRKIKSGDMR